ncbi:MAG: hypothetical protein E7573_07505 [Ruminococcaceae bacterium]|nr:hypothetical protein [Oscillospiraceae bacterium]MBR3596284.1 hypothetical protein [Clostridia bacterium]
MKKKTKATICIFLVLVIALGITAAVQLSKSPIGSSITITAHTKAPQVFIAHRGFSSVLPENTLPAIEGAVNEGFYGCEFDIHTTKDGIWILNHDSNIDKMTDGSGDIKEYTFEELQEFTIDNGNGIENYPEMKLPKLSDALDILKNSDVIPFIEIKGYDPIAFASLLEIIDEYEYSDTAVIISFDMEALLGIRELNKDIKLMYLTNNLTKEDVDICKENGNIGVDINGGNIFKMKDALSYAEECGLETAAWTVDIPLHADLLNMFGIKHITTNRITP